MSCLTVQCISVSPFFLQVFTSLAQKTNKQLELHIKILIIIPIFFFSFSFFGLNRTYTMSSSPVFKVREYKVIRTLDTNKMKQKNMFREHVFKLYHFCFFGGKVNTLPAHQSAQAFLANHKNHPRCQSHSPELYQKSGSLCLDLEYNHNLFYTEKKNQKWNNLVCYIS